MTNSVRIVAWNCAGNFRRKSAIIAETQPDVIVISEAEESGADALPDTTGSIWAGTGRRGLAIVALNGWRLEPAQVQIAERLFLPVRLSRGDVAFNLIGACVKKTTDYVSPTKSALERLAEFATSAPTVIAGDFNQSVVFDKRRSPSRRFARVLERLDAIEFRSAWHSFMNEPMGVESRPTLYWRWQDAPKSHFHIDYAFVSKDIAINSAKLGDYRKYVEAGFSDHVPLVVDLTLPRLPT